MAIYQRSIRKVVYMKKNQAPQQVSLNRIPPFLYSSDMWTLLGCLCFS